MIVMYVESADKLISIFRDLCARLKYVKETKWSYISYKRVTILSVNFEWNNCDLIDEELAKRIILHHS